MLIGSKKRTTTNNLFETRNVGLSEIDGQAIVGDYNTILATDHGALDVLRDGFDDLMYGVTRLLSAGDAQAGQMADVALGTNFEMGATSRFAMSEMADVALGTNFEMGATSRFAMSEMGGLARDALFDMVQMGSQAMGLVGDVSTTAIHEVGDANARVTALADWYGDSLADVHNRSLVGMEAATTNALSYAANATRADASLMTEQVIKWGAIALGVGFATAAVVALAR